MFKIIAVVATVGILALVNWSILIKEKHLSEGQVVYLDLRPVDPRSLMQGDYMALRFKLGDEVEKALRNRHQISLDGSFISSTGGLAVVSLDERDIGTFKQIEDESGISTQDKPQKEILIQYRVRKGQVKLATNAYFFQEGKAALYNAAKYGQFRVDDSGELLLAAMYDKDLNRLGDGEL